MKFTNFQSFNEYLGVSKPISEHIDFGSYDISGDLRKRSGSVSVDFYRVSLKENITYKYDDVTYKNRSLVFFNSPDQSFDWKIESNWNGFYLNISKEIIDKHRFIFKNCLEYGKHEALVVDEKQSLELKRIFAILIQHYSEPNYDLDIVILYTDIIISLVERFYFRQFLNNKKEFNHLVSRFQLLLENYYRNPEYQLPSVSSLAKKMNVSPNYLGDVIRIHTNKSASEHIQEKVIKKAKDLLKNTSMSVSEISYLLGFEYPNYFSRQFKKHTSLTPKNFRNQ